MIWLTQMREEIPLNHMTLDHLRNCIGKVQNSRRGWRLHWLPFLLQELDMREMG